MRSLLVWGVTLGFSGCLLEGSGPETVPIQGDSTPVTVPPGVRLRVHYETGAYPDPILQFTAFADNLSNRTLYTRGECYTPWQWTLSTQGRTVERGPPEVTCQPIAWREFVAATSGVHTGGWNGSVWHPDEGTLDSGDGTYEWADAGEYVATVTFAFYEAKDESKYCCPQVVSTDIRFRIV